jgi:tRNA threonylcarbamoyladenosine biosynthesis protein TsaE
MIPVRTMRLQATVELADERATEALARQIAAAAQRGDVIALHGDLGAGKTVFARAFIRSRTSAEEEVPSPTFTLVQTYVPPGDANTAPAIWHFDLFRLDDPEDALELGVEDAFASAITLVEWPERLGSLLPPRSLRVTLAPGAHPDSRRAILDADESWRLRLSEVAPVRGRA